MAPVKSSAIQVPAMVRESDGALMVWTSGGYRPAAELGIDLDSSNAVSIDTIETGADELQQWAKVVQLAERHSIKPIQTPAGPMPNSSVILGETGDPADFLQYIETLPRATTDAAVYLEYGNAADTILGSAGTAPAAAATSLSLTASLAFTAAGFGPVTENQLAGCILWFTYTPMNAGRSIKVMREIVSHPAYAAGTAFVPVVTHGVLAGGAITGWGVRPRDAAEQIAGFDSLGRRFNFNFQAAAEGGLRISVDRRVSVIAGGQFKW